MKIEIFESKRFQMKILHQGSFHEIVRTAIINYVVNLLFF